MRCLGLETRKAKVAVTKYPERNKLVCDLVKVIHYETLEEMYQEQRCFTGKDCKTDVPPNLSDSCSGLIIRLKRPQF